MDDYAGRNFAVCGVNYNDGWERYRKTGPLSRTEFVTFLQKIHKCEEYEDVVRAVKHDSSNRLLKVLGGLCRG